MKKVYFHQCSDGCIESMLDFANARNALLKDAWEVTRNVADADLVLVNTCIVAQTVEDHCFRDIESLKKRKRADAEIVVTGCMPDYAASRLRQSGIDFTFSPKKMESFLQRYDLEPPGFESESVESEYLGPYNLFNWAGKLLDRLGPTGIPLPEYLYRRFAMVEDETMEYLRISRGCLDRCSYCATRFATGRLVSESPDRVLLRFREALKAGKRSIVLCGEDTGAYGQDAGLTFVDLLARILESRERFVLSIRQHHPRWVIQDLDRYLDLLADPRVKSFNLPVQSGSDRILRLMERAYTVRQAEEMVVRIHRRAPHIMLRTHMIVGFPSETREDFRKTLTFVQRTPWDMVLAFPYTDRPRTAAAKIREKVSKPELVYRMLRLNLLILWKVYLNAGRMSPFTRTNPMKPPEDSTR